MLTQGKKKRRRGLSQREVRISKKGRSGPVRVLAQKRNGTGRQGIRGKKRGEREKKAVKNGPFLGESQAKGTLKKRWGGEEKC